MHIQKKLAVLVAVLALVLSLSAPVVSAESYPCIGVVTAYSVNIRSGAGTNFEIVDRVDAGITMDVYARVNNWYKIGLGGGKTAFICADYVSIRPEDVAARGQFTGGNRIVQIAKQYLGTPYVYGGSSPSGFDCSGFTSFVYRQMGYTLNRVAHDQLANGIPVNKNELRPGDLVLFKRAGNTYVHHVGIYVGDGMLIHSPQTGDVVKYTSIVSGYYNDCYYAARRIIR